MKTKTDTNPPILCVRCKGAGANVYGGGVWSHHFWRDCIEHLTARVEAAEARVAELEAEAAAQGWRPGSETPNAIDTYLVYRAAPPQNEPWRYDFAVWEDDGWDTEGFTHYRPLPPAPDAQEPTP